MLNRLSLPSLPSLSSLTSTPLPEQCDGPKHNECTTNAAYQYNPDNTEYASHYCPEHAEEHRTPEWTIDDISTWNTDTLEYTPDQNALKTQFQQPPAKVATLIESTFTALTTIHNPHTNTITITADLELYPKNKTEYHNVYVSNPITTINYTSATESCTTYNIELGTTDTLYAFNKSTNATTALKPYLDKWLDTQCTYLYGHLFGVPESAPHSSSEYSLPYHYLPGANAYSTSNDDPRTHTYSTTCVCPECDAMWTQLLRTHTTDNTIDSLKHRLYCPDCSHTTIPNQNISQLTKQA